MAYVNSLFTYLQFVQGWEVGTNGIFMPEEPEIMK